MIFLLLYIPRWKSKWPRSNFPTAKIFLQRLLIIISQANIEGVWFIADQNETKRYETNRTKKNQIEPRRNKDHLCKQTNNSTTCNNGSSRMPRFLQGSPLSGQELFHQLGTSFICPISLTKCQLKPTPLHNIKGVRKCVFSKSLLTL